MGPVQYLIPAPVPPVSAPIDGVIDKCVRLIETLIPELLLQCYRVGDDDNIMRASLAMLDYR